MDQKTKQTLRRWLRNTLLVAFLYSCLVHVVLLGLWKLGILELPDELVQMLFKRKPPSAEVRKPPQPTNAPAPPKEIPLTFIEVEPDTATPQAPKDARYYSKSSSQAANPDSKKDLPVPQVDGRQERMARLRDVPRAVLPTPPPPAAAPPPAVVPRPNENTLQPAPVTTGNFPIPAPLEPQPKTPEPERPVEMAKATPPIKDLPRDISTIDPNATPQPTPPRVRPRTLAQAREQAGLAGEKMKQEGGARRVGSLSVDAKATPFGAYDAAMIKAIQDRWYYLLDNTTVTPRSGRVVLDFTLNNNGKVSDMRVRMTEVGEVLALLCQRAITDQTYAKWPLDMHRMVGGNIRPITITFLYY